VRIYSSPPSYATANRPTPAGPSTSLRELGLDFVDLYLIHWPVPSQNLYVQAWQALEEIYTEGLSRAIGVSNFLAEHLETLLAAGGTVPAVNQIEIHPTFQQREVAALSRRHGIAVEAYSPLGQGGDLESRTVTAIAAKYLATPAQVVLAWHLANGNIVIPKSANPDRIAKNLAAARLTLDAEDLAAITALDAGGRIGADPSTATFTQL